MSSKANGYQSLHIVVQSGGQPMEVQIRSEDMHREAEYGSCGHWSYKAGDEAEASDAALHAGREHCLHNVMNRSRKKFQLLSKTNRKLKFP